ncbi:MAG: endopeptidase La, partial [Muribaculum sp.]|nr:endopeptidase La [Muribaculum sp.]
AIPLPDNIMSTFDKEINKLSRLNPQSPEYNVQYSFLETLLDLPWNKQAHMSTDFKAASATLEHDHYGLEKVKERIIEQLAAMWHNPDGKMPILCLVGPPGVGKTSIGQSIADALKLPFQRVSLGGLHDEAEIRGHRRTYIGAMPGRIIEAMRRAGVSNPVILLDEVDKIGADFKGDPSAAMLEVLDPEQNCRFHDNYIDVDYDLSNVLFIATANTLSTLSQPLLDRMEIIEIPGYLIEEKVEIAKRHLIPRLRKQYKLSAREFSITDAAIAEIVECYTAESGVRQLNKELAKIARKRVLSIVKDSKDKFQKVTPANLSQYLGVARFSRDRYEGNDFAGVVTGLAWTAVGGEILYIEASLSKGTGDKLTLTGNLGNVMKESAAIALQWVHSHAATLNIDEKLFDQYRLHLHVPEGAIPKDGPSAGITMATAITSAFTRRKVMPRLAMTGEITLRGKVLPVGGIKEKILAAKRAGINTIILSEQNRKDISDIEPRYIDGLTFHYVSTVDQVISLALLDERADNLLTSN